MHNVDIICEKGVSVPAAATPGSSAVDLVANVSEPIAVAAGDTVVIPTGIRIDMTKAKGLCAVLMPRSGLGVKKGLVLANTVGLIDNDYQGEIKIPVLNRNPTVKHSGMGQVRGQTLIIEPGMRLAQMMFLKSETSFVLFNQVEEFGEETERAEGGFGSTGTRSSKAK